MSISKAYAIGHYDAAAGATTTTGTFDSTGYTHLVCHLRHQTNADPATASDNKGSDGWNYGPVQAVSASTWSRLAWTKIKAPGTGHTVTLNTNALASDKFIGVYLVNVSNGVLELVDTLEASGSTAVDTPVSAGNLDNPGGAEVVSFYGLNSWIGTHFSDPGTGWTQDYDAGIAHNSRAGDTATTIACDFTLRTAGGNWGVVAACFKERGPSAHYGHSPDLPRMRTGLRR